MSRVRRAFAGEDNDRNEVNLLDGPGHQVGWVLFENEKFGRVGECCGRLQI
jgi:hypothetical protein